MADTASVVEYPDYPVAYILAALSLLTVILNLPVAVWHYQHRNVAAFSLVFWLLLINTSQLANSLIWPNDDYDHWWHGKGFCDAQVYLYWGSVIGMAGAVACIMRGLAKVMDTKNTVVAPTKGDRRKAMVHDAVFCFGLPGLMMFALYVVQTRRFDIQGLNGCIAEVDDSWVAIFLLEIWPLVISLLGGYYAALVIIRLYRYRQEFSRLLDAHNQTRSRFIRLFLISATCIIGLIPIQAFLLAYNASFEMHPYSWSKVHGPEWNTILLVRSNGQVLPDRWLRIGLGFLEFFFFGIGQDAMGMYRRWLVALGLSHLFPSLTRQQRQTSSSSSSSWSSIGSRAKSLLRWKKLDTSTISSSGTTTNTTLERPARAELDAINSPGKWSFFSTLSGDRDRQQCVLPLTEIRRELEGPANLLAVE